MAQWLIDVQELFKKTSSSDDKTLQLVGNLIKSNFILDLVESTNFDVAYNAIDLAGHMYYFEVKSQVIYFQKHKLLKALERIDLDYFDQDQKVKLCTRIMVLLSNSLALGEELDHYTIENLDFI